VITIKKFDASRLDYRNKVFPDRATDTNEATAAEYADWCFMAGFIAAVSATGPLEVEIGLGEHVMRCMDAAKPGWMKGGES
jgi:hypothetical protein